MNKSEKIILLIDGNSFFYRSYYGSLSLAQNTQNNYNAIYTSIRMLRKFYLENDNYSKIIFAFDLGKKTFRHNLYKEYKSQRKKTPDEVFVQMKIFENFLKQNEILYIKDERYEADDIIATLAKKAVQKNWRADVISGDRDLLQIIDENINLFMFKRGVSEMKLVNKNNFYTEYKIFPRQFVDYKALVGDSSDNLPGVKGIGPKTALNLIQNYDNLDFIYKNIKNLKKPVQEKLINNRKNAYLTKKMNQIKSDIDLEIEWKKQKYDFYSQENKKFYIKYSMFSLLKKPKNPFKIKIRKFDF